MTDESKRRPRLSGPVMFTGGRSEKQSDFDQGVRGIHGYTTPVAPGTEGNFKPHPDAAPSLRIRLREPNPKDS